MITDYVEERKETNEERVKKLTDEFSNYFQSHIQNSPEDKDRINKIFREWVIQKIAELQIHCKIETERIIKIDK
jgi:hypothetical protein